MPQSEQRSFAPVDTPPGDLPPWEVAKAYAFHAVIVKMREVTGLSTRRLVGSRQDEFIAAHDTTASGRQPGVRAVRHVVSRCENPDWYPGKERLRGAGRPPVYSEFRKHTIAVLAKLSDRTVSFKTLHSMQRRPVFSSVRL